MLTDPKVRAAKPHQKPYKLSDREGLYLYVAPSGARSWRFDYRLAGVRETLTIGRYPEIGLGDAREELAKARRMIAKGQSPANSKQELLTAAKVARKNTLRAFGEDWYAARAKGRSESWKGNARRWLDQDIYPALGDRPIKEIRADDVERLVKHIAGKRGATSGHYARLTLSAIYKSLPRSLGVGNPARDAAGIIELPKGKPRGRALTGKEIPAFFEAADRYPGRDATKLAIRLLMLTFVRKLELIEAQWDEIDLDEGEWVIPAERMKMAKPHIVPLSRQAVECLKKLKPLAFGSAYVFPNLGDPKRPMGASTMNKAFDEMGWGGKFTPHGARSTASTSLNAQGWSADAIERQLAHAERDLVRAAYNHSDFMDERQRMMQAWADYLDALCSGKVIPIRAKVAA